MACWVLEFGGFDRIYALRRIGTCGRSFLGRVSEWMCNVLGELGFPYWERVSVGRMSESMTLERGQFEM